jgi:hypothetical protein
MEQSKVKREGVCFRVDYLKTFESLQDFQKAHSDIDKSILKQLWNDCNRENPQVATGKRKTSGKSGS